MRPGVDVDLTIVTHKASLLHSPNILLIIVVLPGRQVRAVNMPVKCHRFILVKGLNILFEMYSIYMCVCIISSKKPAYYMKAWRPKLKCKRLNIEY